MARKVATPSRTGTVRPDLVFGLSRVVASFTTTGARLELLRVLVCDTATFRITAREYLLFETELAEIGTFIDHFQSAFTSCGRADWVTVQQSIVLDFIECRVSKALRSLRSCDLALV